MSSRRRKLQLTSSSDEDQQVDDERAKKLPVKRRVSDRIQRKERRPAFQLPSRQTVWDAIPSQKSPTKYFSPRRTVSDFTKVYNKYNFDDYEDSSDDEGERFIRESSGNSDDDSSSGDKKAFANHRVKNYHRRIRVDSSSSDEDLHTPAKSGREGGEQVSTSKDTSGEVRNNVNDDDETSKSSSRKENSEEGAVDWQHDCNNGSDSSSDEVMPYRRSRNVSVLMSDDDDDDISRKNTCADKEEPVKTGDLSSSNSAKASEKNEGPSTSSAKVVLGNDPALGAEACVKEESHYSREADTPPEKKNPTSSTVEALLGNESLLSNGVDDGKPEDDGDCSSNRDDEALAGNGDVTSDEDDNFSSDADSSHDENESRSDRLRRKSKDIFKQFKDVQAKRKFSLRTNAST